MKKLILSIFLFTAFAGFAQKQDLPLTRILFVFDGSQSMYGRWESGNKIDIAKRMMTKMLDSLQSVNSKEFQLALRVYGHQKPVPPQDCNDTRLEVGFGFNNIPRIKKVLRNIQPKGTTPIANSLQRAGTDFPPCQNCRNIIILITDGVESCDGDPCAISKMLQKKGIALKPFVIGVGLDDNFKSTFECVGNYYDAANEKDFKKVLDIVITQALDNTTAQVNLLDEKGKPSETDVPFTLFDEISGKPIYNFVHTLNYRGNPDTLILDPLLTYKLQVHTLPPVVKRNIEVIPGKHTQIGVSTPRGSLKIQTNTKLNYDIPVLVRKNGKTEILNVLTLGETQKYIVGEYDIEILTLPRLKQKGIRIDQSKTTQISIPNPGVLSLQARASGYGSIFKVEKDQSLTWVVDLDPKTSRTTLNLLPGNYQVIFRPKNAQQTFYSISEKFNISSGTTTIVKLN